MEFVNILLQMEVKAVKNTSSLLQFSGLSELENGLFQLDQESDRQRWLGAGFSLF